MTQKETALVDTLKQIVNIARKQYDHDGTWDKVQTIAEEAIEEAERPAIFWQGNNAGV